MKLSEVVEKLELEVVNGKEFLDREVNGVYINDLLSWVMSHGEKDNLWITVQVHPNIIAIAVLLELACIIIPENISVEDATIEKAKQEEVIILRSYMTSYELALRFGEIGL